jgi:hypothetical protein
MSVIVMVAFTCLGFASTKAPSEDRTLAETRELIRPLLWARYDTVCDERGVVSPIVAKPNCFSRNGYRVWRDRGRLYVASLINDHVVIELAVDEQRLLDNRPNAIIQRSNSFDISRMLKSATSF